jgi:hypothetical protein
MGDKQMTDKEWQRQIQIAADNLRFLFQIGNGSHIERSGNNVTTVYHPMTGNLLEANKLVMEAERLVNQTQGIIM